MILLKRFGKFQPIFLQFSFFLAMCKTWNTGTRNGMQGTRGIGGLLYSGKYRQTLGGISSNIPEIVGKNSGECREKFRGMSLNIRGYVLNYTGECRQTFRGISLKILPNAHKGPPPDDCF